MKKSLIHTDQSTNETRWLIASADTELTIEQYLQVVDIGFQDEVSNFQWVDQPEQVSKSTHKYTSEGFVALTEEELKAIADAANPAPSLESIVAEQRRRLTSSLWTQAPDEREAMGAEKAAQWDAYRAALRAVTKDLIDTTSVVWPEEPKQ